MNNLEKTTKLLLNKEIKKLEKEIKSILSNKITS